MKLDAHQHFWAYDPEQYAWIGEDMRALRRDFLPKDLDLETGPLGVDASIAVQARQTEEETRWLLDLAEKNPRIFGVVGWVDLKAADIQSRLTRLKAPKLLGLRHVVQGEADDLFMLDPTFLRGLAALEGQGLVYDFLVFPRQLPAAIAVADRLPRQAFVLDHLGKPPAAFGQLEPWAGLIRQLALRPNVSCKLSGLVTEADWKQWTSAGLQPYFDVILEAFGPERLMFGSDWPVCKAAARYGQVLGLAEEFIRPLSADEQLGILGGNARRIYGGKK